MTFSLNTIIAGLLQVAFVLLFSPFIIGVIRKIKARYQGREGATVFQPYFDLAKLLMKGTVKSSSTTWIFDFSPIASFSTVVVCAMLIPMFSADTIFSSTNIVFFIYIFAIGRLFTTLSGLDAASSFGGLGSSREMLLSAFIEPILMMVVLFFSVLAGSSTELSKMALSVSSIQTNSLTVLSPAWVFASIAFIILLFAEMKRLPFDNPATHLELTMVHEAMILENSGPNLALVEWANAAKLVLLASLFGILFTPISFLWGNIGVLAIAFALLSIAFSIIVAIVESSLVKIRLFKVTELLMLAFIFSLTAFLSLHYKIDLTNHLFEGLMVTAMFGSAAIFIMSATFRWRVRLFVINSIALSLILLIAALETQSVDAYFRLFSTIILKVAIAPILFYTLFTRLTNAQGKKGGETGQNRREAFQKMVAFDPLFLTKVPTLSVLTAIAAIVIVSFAISNALGGVNLLFPLAISVILIGVLVVATKQHVLLQLFGLFIIENGIVLLPVILALDIPFLTEAATLLDTVVLIAVAVALIIKTGQTIGSLDSRNLDELIER